MKLRKVSPILFIMALLLLVACSEAENPTPTAVAVVAEPTATDTATPAPTDTPTPLPTDTSTPLPTDTPPPTATPTETPSPTPVPMTTITINDDVTGDPLSGLTVSLAAPDDGVTYTQTSDENGVVVFENVPDGSYELTIADGEVVVYSEEEVALSGVGEMAYDLTITVFAEITAEEVILNEGPDTIYDNLGTVVAGDSFTVIGQNDDGTWFQIAYENEDGEIVGAWVALENIELSGNPRAVAAVDAPPTPTPGPTAIPVTPTPEIIDYVTLYYVSNPSDILGTFPVKNFNGNELYNRMLTVRNSLNVMNANINNARNGDAAACQNYVNAYNNILYSGTLYDNVPADWEDIYNAYVVSFIFSLDRTRPAYLSCVDAGTVDNFNADLAVQTIAQTLSFLNPFVDAAAAKQ